MPERKFKTKRDQSGEPLARLIERWGKDHEGEWEGHLEPVVTPMLKGAIGGIKRVIEALRAHDDDDARAFLETYDACSAKDRPRLRLEDIAFASGIGSLRLAEVAQTALFLYADTETKLLISSAMHKVTRSIIKAATDEVPIVALDRETGDNVVVGKTNGDVKAMELFGKISGQVPLPKNTVNNYTQNNFGEREERRTEPAHTWKYPEDRLKEIVGVINPKQLPAPQVTDELIHFEQNRPVVFERR